MFPCLFGLIAIGISLSSFLLSNRIAGNYDIKKQFLKSQFEAVSEMLKEINNTAFVVSNYSVSENSESAGYYIVNLQEVDEEYLRLRASDTQILSFYQNFIDHWKLYKHSKNVFMPKEIASELSKLNLTTYQARELRNSGHYKFLDISITGDYTERPSNLITPITSLPIYENILTLLKQVLVIKQTAAKWIKSFEIDDINIEGI
ncbi:MAG: hypothetical protein IPP27_17595 [Bacteroidetes bacterium]|nr:hypothetical protein [Bacteroidota bacterium]